MIRKCIQNLIIKQKTNKYVWYNKVRNIKILNGEYKFEAYFSGKNGKYISLRHEDNKYISVTKNGLLLYI